ncbi:MAG: DNA strand exchange inhibitor protein [Planctomycetes bacterium]|nr:DNA strand exchange inhibitor protein [Planctomycetota bacterium]
MIDQATLDKLEFSRATELIAARCACSLGKSLARRITPSTRPAVVRRWLDQVRQMADAAERIGLPPMGGVHDIRALIAQSEQPAGLGPEELALVSEVLRATGVVQRWASQLTDQEPQLIDVGERVGDFSAIAATIDRCIDARGQVYDHASPKLGTIRASISRVRDQLRGVFDRLLRQPRTVRLLQYANATFHDDRTVLPLKAEHRGRIKGIVHRSSDSGSTVFVEPAEAVELNNSIVTLRDSERREIDRILQGLSWTVRANVREILQSLSALGVLDLISAKVHYSRRWDAVCPEIRDDRVLHLHQARHPLLLELFAADDAGDEEGAKTDPRADGGRQVVPIDVRLADDFDLLVITGPNTGGKTVALKTVGLLAAMVQAGIPVPVGRGSSMPVYRQILIDVGDEQSIQQSLSTFSSHMANILGILQRVGPRSLVLLDELGAGTDPDEGAAIGRAIIDELLRLGCSAVVSTHLAVLKAVAYVADRVDNASVEFDVQSLQPTYRLRLGEPGNSNALVIAERLGMPKRLVSQARGHLTGRHRALNKAIAGTLDSRRQAEHARNAALAARQAAEDAERRSDRQQKELEKAQADYHTWIDWITHLAPGDKVYVQPFDRQATVVRMQLHQQTAVVSTGAIDLEVKLKDLQHPDTVRS